MESGSRHGQVSVPPREKAAILSWPPQPDTLPSPAPPAPSGRLSHTTVCPDARPLRTPAQGRGRMAEASLSLLAPLLLRPQAAARYAGTLHGTGP